MMRKVYKSLLCVALPLTTLGTLTYVNSVRAQSITPDATLGNESSVVNTNVDVGKGIPSDRIDGGATRGNNLFHSFSNFNVDAGRGAYFKNPAGIENIISRVTGSNISNILGTLGVLGNANLFFANPNGIVFGPNARLDVSGSFFATTSDSFNFDNGFEFSASNPQAPPLLTVNTPIGLRFRDNPGKIENNSQFRPVPSDTSSNPTGLQVLPGNTLALLGGDVVLNGGNINAPGARVEIGGLAEAGTIGLENNGGNFQVNFPTNVLLSDVTLADDARVAVRGSDSRGDIFVNANIFTALRGGRLTNGTEGTVDGGNITVNSNEVNLSGVGVSGLGAGIYQQALDNASGNAGKIDINVKTGNFSLSDNAVIDARTFGKGNAGRVNIQVENGDFTLDSSNIFSNNLGTGDIGDAGKIDINVKTGNFSLSNNAELNASTFGQGNANNINIQVENGDIALNSSYIFSNVGSDAIGNAGEINLNAKNIFLKDGSQLQSRILGQGNGAKVSLVASGEISFTGFNGSLSSAIFTRVEGETLNKGSDIEIKAGNLSLEDASQINSSTFGIGNAGDIDIQAGNLSLDGASLFANTFGKGDAGIISVTVDDSIKLANSSFIDSTVQPGAEGIGGDIILKGRSLTITDGSQVLNGVFRASDGKPGGIGKAGNIVIDMTDFVNISGVGSSRSGLFASAEAGTTATQSEAAGDIKVTTGDFRISDGGLVNASTANSGNGGKITISANKFTATNSGDITTSTSGTGNAGTISLTVNDSINLANSSIISSIVNSGGEGDAGEIDIKTGNLSITNGAEINSSTFGSGDAGNVNILAENGDVFLTNSSAIFSSVETTGIGDAGEINVSAKNILLENSSQIINSIRGDGSGKKISLIASERVSLKGFSISNDGNTIFLSGLRSNVEVGGKGNAGEIEIKTRNLSIKDGARITSQTLGQGNAGTVTIDEIDGNLPNISFDGTVVFGGTTFASGIFTTVGRVTPESTDTRIGGDINITAQSLELTNGAQIDSSTFGIGNAGNVNILAENGDVTLTSSAIFSNVGTNGIGDAGEINVGAKNIFLKDGSQIQSLIRGEGDGTKISLVASEGVSFTGFSTNDEGNEGFFPSGLRSNVVSGGKGNAGEIEIKTRNLSIKDGATIFSGTSGQGNAGTVTIDGTDNDLPKVIFDGTGVFGGDTFASGIFTTVERVTPEPTGLRIGGDINITAQSLELTNGALIDSRTFGKGNAGTISVTVDDSINLSKTSSILSIVDAGGKGIAGDINLTGRSLTVKDGSQIGTSVVRARNSQSAGIGKAGNIIINMTDSINIVGFSDNGFSSGLLASGERGTTATESQAAGDITVTTGDFRIADGGIVNASTSNNGDGGDITINARNFTATNGGKIFTSTSNTGDAGDIKLNIDDRITIAGVDSNFEQRLAILEQAGEEVDNSRELGAASGILANTFSGSTGNGGNIDIDPKTVEILDGATVSAESRGQGTAGDINIVSDEILLLRRGGTISTASTTDGGDISIKTGVLVTLPNENTDITASAANQGGRITIDALGIFGFEFRSQQDLESLGIDNFTDLQTSDISATGGNPTLTGEIIVNNPEIDPNNGLVELPEVVVDANKQVAQNACKQGVGSEFVATGRGGLPPNPTEDLTSSTVRVGLTTPVASKTTTNTIAIQPQSTPTAQKIVPAQGWVFNSKGEVVLTAYDPNEVGVQRTAHKGLCKPK